MRKPIAVAALLAAAVLPAPASARIFVGLRAGWALPFGDLLTGRPLKDSVRSQVPVTLDLGLLIGDALEVGAYAAYGYVQPSRSWQETCDASGSDCTAAQLRIGGQANLLAASSARTHFWGGVAAGYQELRLEDSLGPVPAVTWKGFDASLQGGLDFLAAGGLRVGPYVSLTIGQFNKAETSSEMNVGGKTLHGWLQVGLRGLFGT